jgi:transposase InsO family protein
LKEHIVDIIEEHPAYGRRRILPELEERTGQTINHKRLRRLLDETDLAMKRCVPDNEPSELRQIVDARRGDLDLVSGRDFGPLEVLSCDFTELHYDGGRRKAWLMAMVDISSRWVPGWAVGPSRNRSLALECWEDARRRLSKRRGNVSGMIVHQDLDSVFTSYAWTRRLLIEDEVRISYSENGANDNPWIESVWGRLKTELKSRIIEAPSLKELKEVIDEHFEYYNDERRHSSIGNMPPKKHLNTLSKNGKIAALN